MAELRTSRDEDIIATKSSPLSEHLCHEIYINIYQKEKNTFVKMETLFGFRSFLKRNFDVISRSESFH